MIQSEQARRGFSAKEKIMLRAGLEKSPVHVERRQGFVGNAFKAAN